MLTRKNMLHDLMEFISFPSVSSQPGERQSMSDCASWLAGRLYESGMQKVKVFPTSAHPVVYAEYIVDSSLPTILFYGHYDVQPADPLNKWKTPPFRPTVTGDHIVGRGASDDKGPVMMQLLAVERQLQTINGLPVNVKFLVEGAEEIGSVGLEEFITQYRELLRCDAVLVSDTKMAAAGHPAITYSLRGSLNAAIEIQTMAGDLHSGTFGGFAPDAAVKMCEFVTGLYNKDHSIAIPHFYEDVRALAPAERAFMALNGPSDKILTQDAAAYDHDGEASYTLHERTTIRPSLSVTGLSSGHQGRGVKSIIPAVAIVKLNFRLVADQQPEKIRQLLDEHIHRSIHGAAVKVIYSSPGRPIFIPRDNFYVRAAALACEKVFGVKPGFLRSGGSIGAVDHFYSILGVPVVLLGFSRAGDNLHAPNESFYLPRFFRGIDTVQQFLQQAASGKIKT